MTFKLLIFLYIMTSFETKTKEDSIAQENPLQQISLENKIGYNKGLLGNKLDYQLVPTIDRKFMLKITNAQQKNVNVKIYDVIGNLILSEDLSEDHQGQKEYDFSDRKTKIFIVKVDTGEENLTKKVTI